MKKFITLFSLLFTILLSAQSTYLHCGKLIDTKKGEVLNKMTIIVTGTNIVAVRKGYILAPSNEDKTIDLTTKTVMPGLIDMPKKLRRTIIA